jgi:hypothetical protein
MVMHDGTMQGDRAFNLLNHLEFDHAMDRIEQFGSLHAISEHCAPEAGAAAFA